jgi:hypothetical protein
MRARHTESRALPLISERFRTSRPDGLLLAVAAYGVACAFWRSRRCRYR